MRLYASRIMCHDDIRAIRRVYDLPVQRTNIQYDHVCRRDFPMNRIQKIFYRIHQWISVYLFFGGLSFSSLAVFITGIYSILKRRFIHRETSSSRSSFQSDYSQSSFQQRPKPPINAFLWHDDLPFN